MTDIADLLDKAADMLNREEVFYSLGLDHDHLDCTYLDTLVTKTDVNGVQYTEVESRPMTEQDMDERIEAQEKFIAALRQAAVNLRDQS